MSDSLVLRSTFARRCSVTVLCRRGASCTVLRARTGAIRSAGFEQRVVLLGQAGGGAQVSLDADVADEDPFVQVALPGGRSIAELAEQYEVGVAGDDPETHAGQRFCDTVTLGDQLRDAA